MVDYLATDGSGKEVIHMFFLLGAWGKLLCVIGQKLRLLTGLIEFCSASSRPGRPAGGGAYCKMIREFDNKHKNLNCYEIEDFIKLRGKLWSFQYAWETERFGYVALLALCRQWSTSRFYKFPICASLCEAYVLGSRWFSCRRHHQTHESYRFLGPHFRFRWLTRVVTRKEGVGNIDYSSGICLLPI